MMRSRSDNGGVAASLAASPVVLAFVLALAVPGWREPFLSLLLLAAILVSLTALVQVIHCLRLRQALLLAAAFALAPLMPLVGGMLLLACARLALLWRCRHLPEWRATRLVPGFPLLEACLVAAAALAAVSAW